MLTSTAVAGQVEAGFEAAESSTKLWWGTYQCISRSHGGHALTAVVLPRAAACAAEQQVAMMLQQQLVLASCPGHAALHWYGPSTEATSRVAAAVQQKAS